MCYVKPDFFRRKCLGMVFLFSKSLMYKLVVGDWGNSEWHMMYKNQMTRKEMVWHDEIMKRVFVKFVMIIRKTKRASNIGVMVWCLD